MLHYGILLKRLINNSVHLLFIFPWLILNNVFFINKHGYNPFIDLYKNISSEYHRINKFKQWPCTSPWLWVKPEWRFHLPRDRWHSGDQQLETSGLPSVTMVRGRNAACGVLLLIIIMIHPIRGGQQRVWWEHSGWTESSKCGALVQDLTNRSDLANGSAWSPHKVHTKSEGFFFFFFWNTFSKLIVNICKV